jgi:hypothetical protein
MPIDWSFKELTCICKQGFNGNACEKQNIQVDFSFNHIEIPQSLSVYFVTVQYRKDPIIIELIRR